MSERQRIRIFRLNKILFFLVVGLTACQPADPVPVSRTPTLAAATAEPSTASLPANTPIPSVTSTNAEVEQESTPTSIPTTASPTATLIPEPTRPISLPGPINPSRIGYQTGGRVNAVTVVENLAYVAVGPRLFVLDVSNPGAIQEIGASGIFPGIINSLVYQDGAVYANTGLTGLWVIDVTSPEKPQPIVTIPTHDVDQKLMLYEGYLVLVDQNFGYPDESAAELRIFDLTDKEAPREIFTMDLPNVVSAIAYLDTYIYLGIGDNHVDSEPGLLILDASDLSAVETAAYLTEFPRTESMLITDNTLYRAPLLESYDLSDPLSPQMIQSFTQYLPVIRNFDLSAEAFLASQVFCDLGGCSSLVAIYPFDDPDDFHIAEIGPFIYDMAVSGSNLFVAAGSQLIIVDLTNLALPKKSGTWSGIGSVAGLALDESTLYTRNHDEYFFSIFELNATSPPSLRRKILYPYFSDINSMAFSANNAYWSGIYEGIKTAGKEQLEEIATVQDPSFYEQNAADILYNQSGYLFGLVNNQLVVIDVSDPENPVMVYPEEWQQTLTGPYQTIFWHEPILFAGESNGRLAVLDATDPVNPVEIGSLDIGKTVCKINSDGDYLYALVGECHQNLTGSSELLVIDVSALENMIIIGRTPLTGPVYGIAVVENYAVIANGDVIIVDIQDPFRPLILETVPTAGIAKSLVSWDAFVYVADGNGGLLTISLPHEGG